ncbi:hypothetical protein AB0M11_08215 [Streptomyces sp. NPDC051987]|uniref:hypothetical protein n=1 Tax=Streptomyces sp. NPDC051987 TaxID=3155808 RepID=UPI00341625B5
MSTPRRPDAMPAPPPPPASPSPLDAHTRAVVRVGEQVTTQLRRIADALNPSAQERADDATTPRPFLPRLLDAVTHSGPGYDLTADAPPRAACRRMETRTCPDSYNGPCGDRPCARFESDDPRPWLDTAEAPAADESAPNMLRVLADRAARGVLSEGEGAALRRRVEQLVTGRETWKGMAEEIEQDRDRLAAELEKLRVVLEYEHKRANDAIGREDTAEQAAEEQQRRAGIAETELRVLREGLRANGADPTQIQNLWAQIRLRNRQWRDTKRELADAQAAIERVRAVACAPDTYEDPADVIQAVRAALDGAEPTTEA